MHDINLFDRYKPKPKQTNYLALLMVLIAVLIIATIVYLEFSYRIKAHNLQNDIDEINELVEDPETIRQLSEINSKNQTKVELAKVLEKLDIIDEFMNYNNIVYKGLLTDLSKAVPQNCFLNRISISENSINLNGYADGYVSVAEFQHSLRNTNRLAKLFNPTITEENSNYSFNFAAKVKVEVNDEDK